MRSRDDRFWAERMALRYLDALDAGNLDAIAALWERAADEPDLARLLDEMNLALEDEAGADDDFAADAVQVVELARRHLPSAFPTPQPQVPLVAADVARRLEAEPEFRRLDPADRVAHAQLLGDATPLPEALGRTALTKWFRDLNVIAGPQYIKAFRNAVVLMDMARAQAEVRLAAARPADPPRDNGRGKT